MSTKEAAKLEREIARDEAKLEKLYDIVRDVRDHYNTKEIEMMAKRRKLHELRQTQRTKNGKG